MQNSLIKLENNIDKFAVCLNKNNSWSEKRYLKKKKKVPQARIRKILSGIKKDGSTG
jgi:hypothetical protein